MPSLFMKGVYMKVYKFLYKNFKKKCTIIRGTEVLYLGLAIRVPIKYQMLCVEFYCETADTIIISVE